MSGPRRVAGDVPAFAAEGVHQLDRSFDQLGGLFDFFDRFRSVRPRDHHAIAADRSIAADFVAQLFAVPIEKPNHQGGQNTTLAAWRCHGKMGTYEVFSRWCSLAVASV